MIPNLGLIGRGPFFIRTDKTVCQGWATALAGRPRHLVGLRASIARFSLSRSVTSNATIWSVGMTEIVTQRGQTISRLKQPYLTREALVFTIDLILLTADSKRRTRARIQLLSPESPIFPSKLRTESIEFGATLRNVFLSASRPVSMAMLNIVKAKSSSALRKSVTIFWPSVS